MTTKSKDEADGAAVPLPPASIDFNKLNDALRAGKSGDEAIDKAIHPDDREYALPKPVEEAVNGSDEDEGMAAAPATASKPASAS
jgi:hypothetical protein